MNGEQLLSKGELGTDHLEGGYGFFVKKRLFSKLWKINSLFTYLTE